MKKQLLGIRYSCLSLIIVSITETKSSKSRKKKKHFKNICNQEYILKNINNYVLKLVIIIIYFLVHLGNMFIFFFLLLLFFGIDF